MNSDTIPYVLLTPSERRALGRMIQRRKRPDTIPEDIWARLRLGGMSCVAPGVFSALMDWNPTLLEHLRRANYQEVKQ